MCECGKGREWGGEEEGQKEREEREGKSLSCVVGGHLSPPVDMENPVEEQCLLRCCA